LRYGAASPHRLFSHFNHSRFHAVTSSRLLAQSLRRAAEPAARAAQE
jgi:hypothetical protein